QKIGDGAPVQARTYRTRTLRAPRTCTARTSGTPRTPSSLNRRSIADLLNARHDQFFTRLQSAEYHVVVANHRAERHGALTRDKRAALAPRLASLARGRPGFRDEGEKLAVDTDHRCDRNGESRIGGPEYL